MVGNTARMSANRTTLQSDVEFLRLFFPLQSEERVAVESAGLLAPVIGDQIRMLRPWTTFAQIFSWVQFSGGDTVGFVSAVEEAFAIDLDPFAQDLEDMTFR